MIKDGLVLRYMDEPLVICNEYWKEFSLDTTTCDALLYYVEGNGTVTINNETYTIVNSSVLLIPRSSKLQFRLNSISTSGKLVTILLREQFLWRYIYSFDKVHDVLKVINHFYKIEREYLPPFFLSLLLYSCQKSLLREDILKNKVFEIVHLVENLVHQNRAEPGKGGKHGMNEESNLSNRLADALLQHKSISQIADDFGVSTSTLKRHFKRDFNIPIKKWINNKRLERAKFLLIYSGRSVKEVAFECGFCSPSYFIRAYKLRYGTTPMMDLDLKIALNN